MGGWSAEREVSLSSGAACAEALETAGYKVTRVDVDRDIAEVLKNLKPDIAFNILHGSFGEDGCMQGVLELLQIPYTHSGVLASALAMNKPRAKDVLSRAGIPLAAGRVIDRHEAAKRHALPVPYVLKPAANGSSVGVFIIRNDELPTELLDDDWSLGDAMLAEEYIAGRELTCGVMDGKALDIIEVTSDLAFYDYEAKYSPGGSRHALPARIPSDVYEAVRRHAAAAHSALGCRGITRADFRYDEETGRLVCLEVNTQPGMTRTSLLPEMAAYAGLSFPDLVDWMVKDASLQR